MTAPRWTTACPDWRERIVHGRSLIPCRPLFPDSAEAGLRIFRALKLVDVAASPTFGELDNRFILDFAEVIFGAYDPQSGRRLINEFFWLISKKNAKSTMAAGIMLTALLLNWRKSASHIILAPTVEIADNSAEPAMDMVAEDPELKTLLKIVANERLIEHRQTGAWLKVVAADEETVGGKKASCVLYDEHWLFGKRAKASRMMREAQGGLATRPEGFVIKLSTQSNEQPAGVFKADLDRFRDIRDGKLVAPQCLGVLYEFPETMIKAGAFRDPSNWHITNPLIDKGLDRQYLLDEKAKADRAGAQEVADFNAKHLNVEIGVALRANRWPGAEYWQRRADKSITFESILARCEVVIVALDGGGLDDLYGLNVLGRESVETEIETEEKNEAGEKVKVRKHEKRWLSWSHAWCHEGVLERRQTIASQLRDFAAAGELTIVGDALEDISEIVSYIEKVKDAGLLHCVAVDPAGLGEMIDALDAIGITQDNKDSGRDFVIGVPQGYALMNAMKTGERKLANGTLLHADQKLMDVCVGNVKVELTPTAQRATKQNAGDAKIDPAMALFDALAVMSTNPGSAGRSGWNTDDLDALMAKIDAAVEAGGALDGHNPPDGGIAA